MIELWEKLLPNEYRDLVVRPLFFESHMDPLANATKFIGFDCHARRCFYHQSFVRTEEGFGADEFPILIDIYFERVLAWRLQKGGWIKVKSFTEHLDGCNRRTRTLPVELAQEIPR